MNITYKGQQINNGERYVLTWDGEDAIFIWQVPVDHSAYYPDENFDSSVLDLAEANDGFIISGNDYVNPDHIRPATADEQIIPDDTWERVQPEDLNYGDRIRILDELSKAQIKAGMTGPEFVLELTVDEENFDEEEPEESIEWGFFVTGDDAPLYRQIS